MEPVAKNDTINEIVLWDKARNVAYSVFYEVDGHGEQLEGYVAKFSDCVRNMAEKVSVSLLMDMAMDDILGL